MKTIIALVFLFGFAAAQQEPVAKNPLIHQGLRITIGHFEARIADGVSALRSHLKTSYKTKIEDEIKNLENGVKAIKTLKRESDAKAIINQLVQHQVALSDLLQAVNVEEQLNRAKNPTVQIVLADTEGLIAKAQKLVQLNPKAFVHVDIANVIVQLKNLVGQIRFPIISNDLYDQMYALTQVHSKLSQILEKAHFQNANLHQGLRITIGHFEARIAEARVALRSHSNTMYKEYIQNEIIELESGVLAIKSLVNPDDAKQIINHLVHHQTTLAHLLQAVAMEEQAAQHKSFQLGMRITVGHFEARIAEARSALRSHLKTSYKAKIETQIKNLESGVEAIKSLKNEADSKKIINQLVQNQVALYDLLQAVNIEEQLSRAKNPTLQFVLADAEGLVAKAQKLVQLNPKAFVHVDISNVIVQLKNLVGQIRFPTISNDLYDQMSALTQTHSKLSQILEKAHFQNANLHQGLRITIGHFEARIAEARNALRSHSKTMYREYIQNEILELESGVLAIKSLVNPDDAKQIINHLVNHQITLSHLLQAVNIEN